jgi:DNA-binding response OmpR family regulator
MVWPVVLVEDNQSDVFLVKEAIAAHSLKIDLRVVTDGAQAVALVTAIDSDPGANVPGLFLLDLNLPRVSGLEVIASVRHSKRCAKTPVLIVTSSDSDKDRTEAATRGANAYFRKPSGYEAFLKLGEIMRELLSVR